VNQQSFKTWFEPIKPVKLDETALTIQVPNKFFYEWLEEHYVNLLKMTIRHELGERGRLEYQILMSRPMDKAKNQDLSKRKTVGETESSDSAIPFAATEALKIKNPFIIPGIKKMKIDAQLNPNYLFNNFIEGDCNRLARSAGAAIAKKPGGTAFNPLVLFGDVGLGKTHLAHAIGNEIVQNFPDKSVLYVSAEKFTSQIIQSIKNNNVADLVNFYHMIDVLIVDDIQFLANKQKTQEIFFHIFNQLHQTSKQIIMTSDRPPKDLEGIEDRLVSRFKWGLSADLSSPDLETRMAILESKMEKEGINLPTNVSEFICYNIKNNIRELEGVLVSIVAQSSLNRKEVDIELTKEVIKNFVTHVNREITIEFILDTVAEDLKVPVEKIKGKSRKRIYVVARHLCMYLAKNLTNKPFKSIGEFFGDRDHTTVIYSNRAINDLMDTDEVFKQTVHEIEKKIKMSLNGL